MARKKDTALYIASARLGDQWITGASPKLDEKNKDEAHPFFFRLDKDRLGVELYQSVSKYDQGGFVYVLIKKDMIKFSRDADDSLIPDIDFMSWLKLKDDIWVSQMRQLDQLQQFAEENKHHLDD